MPPKKTTHDSVLARYNNFLDGSKFDENGNPFSETVVQTRQLPDWTLTKHRQHKILVLEGGDPLRHKTDGPPSLWDIVRRFLNKNLKDLSVEALEAVPWEVTKYIWTDALATGQDNFRIWALFASVYGDEPGFNCISGDTPQRYNRRALINGHVGMDSLIAQISSPAFKWLVDLNLQYSNGYTRFDFLELPDLPNLGALNISSYNQDLNIDDGIIRTWAMAAARQGKLTMLKVLVARNHLQVTARALEYLGWIKSLRIVDVTGCGVTEVGGIRKLGWVKDLSFVDTFEGPPELCAIIGGEKKQVVQPLVLQVRIEALVPIPKRAFARNPMVYCREISFVSAKRKHNDIPSPLKMTSETGNVTRKPKILRACKKKDIGSLLAEFGMGSSLGGSSRY